MSMLKNLTRTIWNPANSDVREGVEMLVARALARGGSVSPELEALFREGYNPHLDTDALAALPDGTLGREYARFIRTNNIVPLGEMIEARGNALAYTLYRSYKLHDVMHVVLGCDASVLGEVRIVAFSLGQAPAEHGYAAKLALVVLLAHLALRAPSQLPQAMRLARVWQELGARTPPYATFKLEDLMTRPVAEVRALVLGDTVGDVDAGAQPKRRVRVKPLRSLVPFHSARA
jgi:ubiquinone biosynthesis protein COQ4